jgi:hypothetical protein
MHSRAKIRKICQGSSRFRNMKSRGSGEVAKEPGNTESAGTSETCNITFYHELQLTSPVLQPHTSPTELCASMRQPAPRMFYINVPPSPPSPLRRRQASSNCHVLPPLSLPYFESHACLIIMSMHPYFCAFVLSKFQGLSMA